MDNGYICVMKHEKKYKEQEAYEEYLNESDVAYSVKKESESEEYDIPVDILVDLANKALLEVENGKGCTTEEAMRFINKEMGWK